MNLYKFTGEPILVMFNCERSARKFTSYTDEQLLDDAFKVLTIMFPHKENLRSSLIDYKRTNWTSDPYARMCYTYLGLESSPADCDVISRPIDRQLYFCGEHTNFEFMGTVNAGYISGIKAAERLIGQETVLLFDFLVCVLLVSSIFS